MTVSHALLSGPTLWTRDVNRRHTVPSIIVHVQRGKEKDTEMLMDVREPLFAQLYDDDDDDDVSPSKQAESSASVVRHSSLQRVSHRRVPPLVGVNTATTDEILQQILDLPPLTFNRSIGRYKRSVTARSLSINQRTHSKKYGFSKLRLRNWRQSVSYENQRFESPLELKKKQNKKKTANIWHYSRL